MKGLPLVLLHGYPFDHTMWERVIAHLDAGMKSIVPDLRGFGSNRASGEPSLDAMADDVSASLPGQAVVAGFSMGGYLAVAPAARQPHLVAGLAALNSQSPADTAARAQG